MKLPKRFSPKLIQLIPEGPGLLLEIGAGSGQARQLLERMGFKWVGLDIRKNLNLVIVADAHFLPFRENVFDIVVSVATLEHLHDPWIAVAEINRVLKQGGFFVGTVAFLEPYHCSYFHFSHLGLKTILTQNNFKIDYLDSGWHGLESIFRTMLILPVGKLWAFLAVAIMMLRAFILKVYIKFGRKKNIDKVKKFLSDESFRFAGSFMFRARKL